jgi:hypothetical protein
MLLKPIIDLFANIIAGTRAALFLPVRLWHFKSNYLQICFLLILSLGLSLVYDYFDTAPNNYFNPYGLSYQALLYLAFFLSLTFIAVLNKREHDLGKLIVLLLSVVPIVWLGSVCLLALSEKQAYLNSYQANWAVFIAYSFWYLLVVGRLLKRFFYLRILPTVGYVSLYALFNFAPLFLLPTESLWYSLPTGSNAVSSSHDIDVEAVYYSQNILLKKNIERLLESNADTDDLFFIGFAGDANEDVFMNEVKSAQTIMDNYFNTLGRSLVLINNKNTVDIVPLANGYNLKNSIIETSKLMDVEDDILLLFLTSHGSEDHYISASFPPFQLKDIGAEKINNALDEAGIKWRIIIISACYSGGFIKPLSGPYTLIITAANAEQNSFGCGHDGQYTYFGEAYLENGLKQTRSFIEAFHVAKKIIEEKENKQGFENSEPQIMIGSEIESKLKEYEKVVKEKKDNNWAVTANE